MSPSELREIKTRFAREYMSRGSGVYAVSACEKDGEPVLRVTLAEGRTLPATDFCGLAVETRVGVPGAVAVANRFG